MISGIFHEGSGLGNQLHRYVAARVRARDISESKEYPCMEQQFSMINPQNFKGKSFMDIDMGIPYEGDGKIDYLEKKTVVDGVDIRGYDPEFNFSTGVIDGEFQDPRYFEHRIDEVREWLKVEPMKISQNTCIIGFRGGEYKLFPDLFLPKEYWKKALSMISGKGLSSEGMTFEMHTDDPGTAREFFPDPSFKIIHDIGLNWRSVRYAKWLIIANSSFYILPALLNRDVKQIIAPRYWARHNTKVWALPQNYYKKFTYI